MNTSSFNIKVTSGDHTFEVGPRKNKGLPVSFDKADIHVVGKDSTYPLSLKPKSFCFEIE